MKKILLYLIFTTVAALSYCSCEKMPAGQGELVIIVFNYDDWPTVNVLPYSTGTATNPPPVASAELHKGRNEITFNLNAGNYLVYCGNRVNDKGVQVVEGETVELYFY